MSLSQHLRINLSYKFHFVGCFPMELIKFKVCNISEHLFGSINLMHISTQSRVKKIITYLGIYQVGLLCESFSRQIPICCWQYSFDEKCGENYSLL